MSSLEIDPQQLTIDGLSIDFQEAWIERASKIDAKWWVVPRRRILPGEYICFRLKDKINKIRFYDELQGKTVGRTRSSNGQEVYSLFIDPGIRSLKLRVESGSKGESKAVGSVTMSPFSEK